MKEIIISKSDFDINNNSSINNFIKKLREIKEPFSVSFNFPISKIPSYLFSFTKLAKITLPSSITEIGASAFNACKYLEEITLPTSLIRIAPRIFENCISLTKINLSSSLDKIEPYVFNNCKSLIEINIPNTVTKIWFNAFNNCTSLTKITLPSSIQYLDSNIFENCQSLQQITIPMSKEKFLETVERAKKFYKDYKKLITFDDKSIDALLSKTNSIEQIITNLEPEH